MYVVRLLLGRRIASQFVVVRLLCGFRYFRIRILIKPRTSTAAVPQLLAALRHPSILQNGRPYWFPGRRAQQQGQLLDHRPWCAQPSIYFTQLPDSLTGKVYDVTDFLDG